MWEVLLKVWCTIYIPAYQEKKLTHMTCLKKTYCVLLFNVKFKYHVKKISPNSIRTTGRNRTFKLLILSSPLSLRNFSDTPLYTTRAQRIQWPNYQNIVTSNCVYITFQNEFINRVEDLKNSWYITIILVIILP